MHSTPYYVYLCLLFTSRFYQWFGMKIRGLKNYTCVQIHITVESLLSTSRWPRHTYDWFYTTSVVYLSQILVCFIFKFVLLSHILVVHTNIFFCERLNFNPLMHNFVNFTIVVLTWYDFTPYSILLPMSIYSQIFHTLRIYFRCVIHVTN